MEVHLGRNGKDDINLTPAFDLARQGIPSMGKSMTVSNVLEGVERVDETQLDGGKIGARSSVNTSSRARTRFGTSTRAKVRYTMASVSSSTSTRVSSSTSARARYTSPRASPSPCPCVFVDDIGMVHRARFEVL